MAQEIINEYGKIVLSSETLAILAGSAATECFGVVGMSSNNILDGIVRLLGKDSISQGVEIEKKVDGLSIKLHIVVGYGTKISVIADNVMQRVRYALEEYASIKISNIQVIVEDVRLID